MLSVSFNTNFPSQCLYFIVYRHFMGSALYSSSACCTNESMLSKYIFCSLRSKCYLYTILENAPKILYSAICPASATRRWDSKLLMMTLHQAKRAVTRRVRPTLVFILFYLCYVIHYSVNHEACVIIYPLNEPYCGAVQFRGSMRGQRRGFISHSFHL